MRITALKVRGQELQDNEQVRVMQWGGGAGSVGVQI